MRRGRDVTFKRKLLRTSLLLILLACLPLLVLVFARGPWVSTPDLVPTLEASPVRLETTVQFLTTDCAPRDYRHVDNLDRAARWIGEHLEAAGLGVEFQDYSLREGHFKNVLGRRSGRDPGRGLVVIGAHYDAYMATPGADDNASGVAVLLELARLTRSQTYQADQLFVAFSTEEPPFYGTGDMGSARLAEALMRAGENVELMVALDLVGTYSDAEGSQPWPLPGMGLVFPTRANFIAVVGDIDASSSIARVKEGMLAARALPVLSIRAPSSLGFVDLSDNLPFRERGLPAVLVTNTAFIRNPHYHRAGDTAETLDYQRMALLTQSLQAMLTRVDSAP